MVKPANKLFSKCVEGMSEGSLESIVNRSVSESGYYFSPRRHACIQLRVFLGVGAKSVL